MIRESQKGYIVFIMCNNAEIWKKKLYLTQYRFNSRFSQLQVFSMCAFWRLQCIPNDSFAFGLAARLLQKFFFSGIYFDKFFSELISNFIKYYIRIIESILSFGGRTILFFFLCKGYGKLSFWKKKIFSDDEHCPIALQCHD